MIGTEEANAGVSPNGLPQASGAPAFQFSIRPASLADVPEILDMVRELASFEKLEHELQVTEASLRASLFGPTRMAFALMAVSENKSIGYALYFRTFSTFVGRPGIFLDDLYVRPTFRRSGVGKALLQEVARIGAENNAGRFEWIALKWNQNALEFYEKLGALIMREWLLLRTDSAGIRRIARGATND